MKRSALLLAIGLLLGSAGFAIGQTTSTGKPRTLCAKKQGGALRLAKASRCAKGETKLTLPGAAAKVAGPTGAAGPAGPAGPQGPSGTPGKDGVSPSTTLEPVRRLKASTGADDCMAETVVEQFCSPFNGEPWGNQGGGREPVGYFKDPLGMVHLQGSTNHPGAGAGGPLIFRLPVGYRPAATQVFATSTGLIPRQLGEILVFSDGRVSLNEGDERNVPLDGITFRAAG